MPLIALLLIPQTPTSSGLLNGVLPVDACEGYAGVDEYCCSQIAISEIRDDLRSKCVLTLETNLSKQIQLLDLRLLDDIIHVNARVVVRRV